MYWDVVEVKPEPAYRLFVPFKDGLNGHVKLQPEKLTGALAPCWTRNFLSRSSSITARSLGPARSISPRMQCTLKSPTKVANWGVS
jgi:hypothetical protein